MIIIGWRHICKTRRMAKHTYLGFFRSYFEGGFINISKENVNVMHVNQ